MIAAGLATLAAAAGAAAPDPALLGCWRTQQVHATYADGSTVESNSDCVTEFLPDVVHSRCRTPNGVVDTVLAWEVTSPGHLRWQPVVPEGASASAAGSPEGPTEVAYRLDGEFSITTRAPTRPVAGGGPALKEMQVLSRRVAAAGPSSCQPPAATTLRIGHGPHSALQMGLPAGWRAQLLDPATTPALAQSIGTDFFVGAFVPRTPAATGTTSPGAPAASEPASRPAAAATPPVPMVIVLDLTRFGAIPVREPEFATLQHDLATRLPDAEVTCQGPQRACFLLRTPKGVLGYTELVQVAGRAAMVSAVGPRPGALGADVLQQAVHAFADRLMRDNAGR